MAEFAYDKLRVAQQFSRAAERYAEHDLLQRLTGQALLAELPAQYQSVVDIGCGPASHSESLAQRSDCYLGLDLAPGMLAQAQQVQPNLQWVLADAEQLPLQANSVAVIFSNLALQWCNHLSRALQQCADALQPQGQLVFSTVLSGSMEPLVGAMRQLDGQVHHNRLLTEQELAQQLARVPNVHWQQRRQQFAIRYTSLTEMVADLKGIGANYTAGGSRGYFGRSRWRALETLLDTQRDENGLLIMNWSIALICGKKSCNKQEKM